MKAQARWEVGIVVFALVLLVEWAVIAAGIWRLR